MDALRSSCMCVAMRMHARTPTADRGSEPDEEDGELGPRGASLGRDHVDRLRVPGPDEVVEAAAQVRHLVVRRRRVGRGRGAPRPGEHAGAHGHRPQRLHHRQVVVRGLAPHRVPSLLAVAEHGPRRLVQQRRRVGASPTLPARAGLGVRGRRAALRLQDDARAGRVAELAEQRVRLERELDDEAGQAARRLLQRQHDAAPAVAVERPREAPARPRGAREGRALGHEAGARAAGGGGRGRGRRRCRSAGLRRRADLQPPAPRRQRQDGDRVPQLLEQPRRPGRAAPPLPVPPRRHLQRLPRRARRPLRRAAAAVVAGAAVEGRGGRGRPGAVDGRQAVAVAVGVVAGAAGGGVDGEAHRRAPGAGEAGVRRPVGRRNGQPCEAAVRWGWPLVILWQGTRDLERTGGGYAYRVVVLPGAGRRLVSRLYHFGAPRFSRVPSVLVLLSSRSTSTTTMAAMAACSARGGAQ
ncbi:hypothetical protein GQ55_6G048200 [Panicum hallii var. hallii]|uniref:Uncharacterized protein n=1 Tax=Panicum hallii var. hallii TaxID=1504633 RepID=A0A2T7D425_9POAL|nr:hypothetical protein GQ55_6G048200 [Panicum hallii var. hallii]